MFLTYTRKTGQLFQVVVAPDSEAAHYESEAQGVFIPDKSLPDDLSAYYVSSEGELVKIPVASAEGTWLWDWDTHTWREVVQPASDTAASEVKA